MKLLIRYAREDGIEVIKGEVLKENTSMISMCQSLGFSVALLRTIPHSPRDAACGGGAGTDLNALRSPQCI